MERIFKKMEECSRYDEKLQKRTWTKEQREIFRSYLIRILRRDKKLREKMMDVPRKYRNTTLALDRFTKLFCLECAFEIEEANKQ